MRLEQTILHKIVRLERGGRPRVLDLFAGCGGLSLGFQAAGFEIAGAVELDPHAAASHGRNFHPASPKHAVPRDITTLQPDALAAELDLGPTASAVDVIVGGPPCQAFARVGRAKLREIDQHPEAFKHDSRALLYLEYLRYVEEFAPLALMIENVPDVLNHGGQNIAEEICEVLEGKGYIARYTLLNAALYGVPQMRERMFVLAYRRELSDSILFPAPTHWMTLPSGYAHTRQVAMKPILVRGDLFGRRSSYIPAPRASRDFQPAVTAEEAIGDLPPIMLHLEGRMRRGAKRFTELTRYDPGLTVSNYARSMRDWPGFGGREGVWDHVIRYLPRDWKLFGRLNPGDQYPEAHRHALAMLEERIAEMAGMGVLVSPGSQEYEQLQASIVPPYDPGKFPNKWRKMSRHQPARTLMAHLAKDGYSHIHYDSRQSRTISVREAARLQSFPDGFQFCGTMNPAFRQIGNAVPPLLAKAVAECVRVVLSRASVRSPRFEVKAV